MLLSLNAAAINKTKYIFTFSASQTITHHTSHINKISDFSSEEI